MGEEGFSSSEILFMYQFLFSLLLKKKKHPYAIQNGSTKCKPRQLLSSLARVIKSAKLFGFLSFKRSWKENWAEQNILLRVLRFAVLSLSWLPSLTDASNGVTHDKQAKLKGDWIPQDLGSLTVADVWPRGYGTELAHTAAPIRIPSSG